MQTRQSHGASSECRQPAWESSLHGAQRTPLGYCAYGLQGTGLKRSGKGCVIEGAGFCEGRAEGVPQFSSLSDPCGHIVRQGPLAENGEAEEVDVDLSDSGSRSVPSHVSTSRR